MVRGYRPRPLSSRSRIQKYLIRVGTIILYGSVIGAVFFYGYQNEWHRSFVPDKAPSSVTELSSVALPIQSSAPTISDTSVVALEGEGDEALVTESVSESDVARIFKHQEKTAHSSFPLKSSPIPSRAVSFVIQMSPRDQVGIKKIKALTIPVAWGEGPGRSIFLSGHHTGRRDAILWITNSESFWKSISDTKRDTTYLSAPQFPLFLIQTCSKGDREALGGLDSRGLCVDQVVRAWPKKGEPAIMMGESLQVVVVRWDRRQASHILKWLSALGRNPRIHVVSIEDALRYQQIEYRRMCHKRSQKIGRTSRWRA